MAGGFARRRGTSRLGIRIDSATPFRAPPCGRRGLSHRLRGLGSTGRLRAGRAVAATARLLPVADRALRHDAAGRDAPPGDDIPGTHEISSAAGSPVRDAHSPCRRDTSRAGNRRPPGRGDHRAHVGDQIYRGNILARFSVTYVCSIDGTEIGRGVGTASVFTPAAYAQLRWGWFGTPGSSARRSAQSRSPPNMSAGPAPRTWSWERNIPPRTGGHCGSTIRTPPSCSTTPQ